MNARLKNGIRKVKSGLAIGFAAALAVALAIGANAGLWSGLNPALLQPLPHSDYFSQHFRPAIHAPVGKEFEGLNRAEPALFSTTSFSTWTQGSAEDSTNAEKLFNESLSSRAAFTAPGDQVRLCIYFEMMSNRCANIFARGNHMR